MYKIKKVERGIQMKSVLTRLPMSEFIFLAEHAASNKMSIAELSRQMIMFCIEEINQQQGMMPREEPDERPTGDEK